ncbi:DUF4837 family protein [candidate division KSB1 bacterium]|nr:DUF4837 family protein [candidate division KSB1 bacterium]NIR72809.1 DUF4837 family protein [candidate division KSB1 bacterium]NIS26849.1 DUF4837 family protein [candidate division KSB1 bacterium]NIT73645.1 DUF4837 family protein [candidate division KSB1 bacterium]NIU27516.1 DUF4837 family protein [candidate division KSB1 bacterium]
MKNVSYLGLITKLSFLLIIALMFNCFRKPAGFGEDTQLFVVADSTNWIQLESTLRDVFERTIRTPQPEKVFELHWVPARKFSQFATRRNLVIAGVLDSEGEIDKRIQNMLSSDVERKVRERDAFAFPKKEPWAEDQLLVVLTSNHLKELEDKLVENDKYLYNLFHEKLIQDTKAQMFAKMEQTELEKELLQKYGWMVRIQHDYIIQTDRPQDRFVMLRRSLPGRERWLFVHWIENADSSKIGKEWALNTRNRLTEKFYKGDYIDEKNTTVKEVEFLGRNALMLQGLWANDEKVAGGPFKNYSFYDDASGRIYMIDIAVYYPAGDKEPFLRQLDVMAHTFKTIHEKGTEEAQEAS